MDGQRDRWCVALNVQASAIRDQMSLIFLRILVFDHTISRFLCGDGHQSTHHIGCWFRIRLWLNVEIRNVRAHINSTSSTWRLQVWMANRKWCRLLTFCPAALTVSNRTIQVWCDDDVFEEKKDRCWCVCVYSGQSRYKSNSINEATTFYTKYRFVNIRYFKFISLHRLHLRRTENENERKM